MLQLTPYQSASNSSVDGLTSADFEKSLEQLNKPEVKEFKLFLKDEEADQGLSSDGVG